MASRKDNKGRVLRTGESQRKNGRYQYRFTDPLGKRQIIYAQTLNDLRAKEQDIQATIADGTNYAEGRITIIELLERYLSLKRNLSPRTMKSYRNSIKRIQATALSKKMLRDVKISDCKKCMLALKDQGYKSSTVQSTGVILTSALAMAVEEDLIAKNPMKFKKDFLDDDSDKVVALTVKETESLLSFMAADKVSQQYLDIFVILLETGLRIGELAGLTFKDLDMNKRLIHITHQLQREKGKFSITAPKSGAGTRTIPLSDHACRAFESVLAKRDRLKAEPMLDGYVGFLFLTRNGTLKAPSDYSSGFDGVEERYNKQHPDSPIRITPHVLRHTFCTNMIYEGMDIKSLQYVMGHANANMIMQVYAHIDKERSIETMRNVLAK